MTLLKKIILVAGARPNFMKIAPIIRELEKHKSEFEWRLVHTGQHYDPGMSDVFFSELGIPAPDFHMGTGGGSHAEQTARIMMSFENYCAEYEPDLVLLVGDVNSTLACSIVAKKLNRKVAHVEAGLRSGDKAMPEEINRLVTDAISDIFFVTEPSGEQNLLKEGHPTEKIHFVGHVMIDNLFHQVKLLNQMDETTFATSGLRRDLGRYGVVTLHRPANVDDEKTLRQILVALSHISTRLPLIFAVHPRTALNIQRYNINLPTTIVCTNPLPYMEFLSLWSRAVIVLTDSGGLQEESTALGIPCITLRENTERPVTVSEGTNTIAGTSAPRSISAFDKAVKREWDVNSKKPRFWDGMASARIIAVLRNL